MSQECLLCLWMVYVLTVSRIYRELAQLLKKINYYIFTSQSKLNYYADSESGLLLPNYVINFGVFGDFSQFLVLIKNLFLTYFSLLENNYYIKYKVCVINKISNSLKTLYLLAKRKFKTLRSLFILFEYLEA